MTFSAEQVKTVAVFGAGSWGTALAIHLAKKKLSVLLWHNVQEEAEKIQADRENARYLPGIRFPESLQCVSDLKKTMQQADLFLVVVPSHVFRAVLLQMKPHWHDHAPLVWATKGIDGNDNQLMDKVAEEILGKQDILAVLSGPTFASEVAIGLPAATTLACRNADAVEPLCDVFKSDTMRVYGTTDVTGAEIGGAVKNVIAIAVGICDGLGFGANARAALMTRGLAEMTRLGVALGGQEETMLGLSGVGDLVLTCTDDKSRNRRFGLLLGKGVKPDEALTQIGQVVEGYTNVQQVRAVAAKHSVEMPITEEVFRICMEGCDPKRSAHALMMR